MKILFLTSFFLVCNSQLSKSSMDMSRQTLNIKSLEENAKQQYRLVRSLQRSPTFVQSRHFHPDQFARDNRDLNQPFSQVFSSYYYSYGGPGTNLAISSQEGCRLTSNFCSRDSQCCSGKCRCVRWTNMGQLSCWKKCF